MEEVQLFKGSFTEDLVSGFLFCFCLFLAEISRMQVQNLIKNIVLKMISRVTDVPTI